MTAPENPQIEDLTAPTQPPARSQGPLGVDSIENPRFTMFLRKPAFLLGMLLVLAVLVFGILDPNHAFFKLETLMVVGLSSSTIIVAAVGTTFLLAARELDLSIGANLILSSVLAAKVLTNVGGSPEQIAVGEYPRLPLALVLGLLTVLAAGALFGLVNGLLVTKLHVNSFLATLATSAAGLGIAFVISDGADVPFIPREIQTGFGRAKIFDVVPLPFVVALIISTVLWVVLNRLRYGLRTLAIGSSPEAAKRAGFDVDRHVISLFVLMGLLVGVAAVIDVSRFTSTNLEGHSTDALQAIAAAVIGGTSLFGGVASITGSVIGAVIPAVLIIGLVVLGISPFYQLIFIGVIIVVAVHIDYRGRQTSD